MDFTDLLSGENQKIVSKLTDGARKTLQRLKSNPNSISKMEWMDLMHELNAMGAVSDTDYTWTRVDFHLIPLGDKENPFPLSKDMRETLLSGGSQWSGNPLNHLDQWAFSLKNGGRSCPGSGISTGVPNTRTSPRFTIRPPPAAGCPT